MEGYKTAVKSFLFNQSIGEHPFFASRVRRRCTVTIEVYRKFVETRSKSRSWCTGNARGGRGSVHCAEPTRRSVRPQALARWDNGRERVKLVLNRKVRRNVQWMRRIPKRVGRRKKHVACFFSFSYFRLSVSNSIVFPFNCQDVWCFFFFIFRKKLENGLGKKWISKRDEIEKASGSWVALSVSFLSRFFVLGSSERKV